MSNFRLRPATAQDETAVTQLLRESYPVLMAADYAPETLEPALPLMCKANPALLSCGTYYLALHQNDCVGCGGWTQSRPGDGMTKTGTGHIRHFATHPSFVRQGIARAIMEMCFTDALSNNIDAFECYSSRSAVQFYESQGFRSLESVDTPLTPDVHFPSIHMLCNLDH